MKRALCYAVLILGAFFLQNNVFAASSLVVTVPNIMLILVFSFGFIRGSLDGMLIGFFCGLLADIFFNDILGVSALVYTCLGFGIGLFGRLYYTEFVNLPLMLCLISDLLYHTGTFLLMFMTKGELHFGIYLKNIVLPELLYTALLTLLLYPLNRRLETVIEKWEMRRTRSYV